MAHGFAAERTFKLPAYAERFVQKGLAVFLFDYRNFGDSDGEPRNLVSPSRHLEDWKAALTHVRGLSNINKDKIALWGTSFSGGHVIVTAARDGGIAAVVSQIPFVDGRATTLTMSLKYSLQATMAGLRDLFRIVALRQPYTIPVVAEPGVFGVMNKEDAVPGYLALVSEGSSWKNECPARVMLMIPSYRPITSASKVNCPVLIVIAENDVYIPAAAVEKTAALIPRAEVVRLPVAHFDMYVEDGFEKSVEAGADFLKRHLLDRT
jgi:pimeloyl-ACP methyl ester carboxylesterase